MNKKPSEWMKYSGLGIQMVVTLLIFLYLGKWLGIKYGSEIVGSLIGIFLGLVLGFVYASRKRIVLTLPLVVAALIPIGLDGTIQLLTDYESTNPKRLITGLIAGVVTGFAIKIIADSLDKK